MKKKLALFLGMLMLAISLCACGADPTTIDYNGKSYSELETESLSYLMTINQLSATFLQSKAPGYTNEEIVNMVLKANSITEDNYKDYGLSKEIIEGTIKYMDVAEKYGDLTGLSTDTDFKVTKSGNTTTSDYILLFTDSAGNVKEVVFELVYQSWNMELTGISIDPVQTLGEKMANAGLNTLISISIVFLVLILISLIIYAFNIFPYIEKKKKEKQERKNAKIDDVEADVNAVPVIEETVNETDDLELVAVIAAAIAASEGCSTSDFVVRSINRR